MILYTMKELKLLAKQNGLRVMTGMQGQIYLVDARNVGSCRSMPEGSLFQRESHNKYKAIA